MIMHHDDNTIATSTIAAMIVTMMTAGMTIRIVAARLTAIVIVMIMETMRNDHDETGSAKLATKVMRMMMCIVC